MFSYIARQPILNTERKTVGYELLFRDGPQNSYPNVDEEQATNQLLNDNFFSLAGPVHITSGKRAFVNFPYDSLIKGTPLLFAKQSFVIEILESCQPTNELFYAVINLYKKGYTLALDDFMPSEAWNRFLPYIHIIKFDIRVLPIEKAARFIEHYKKRTNIRFLAEKVETYEEFIAAKDAGFELFQGYFFSKPEMLQRKSLKPSALTAIRLLKEICVDEVNYDKVEEIIATDVSLSYKLLRHVNMMTSNRAKPIASFKQALVYLGEEKLRRFITFVVTSHALQAKPQALHNLSLQRAYFCESLSKLVNNNIDGNQAFLTGLFSLLDSLLDQPLTDLVNNLPLTQDVKDALIERTGQLGDILQLAEAFDNAQWDTVNYYNRFLGLKEESIAELYLESVQWATTFEKNWQQVND
ncbi:EAL and HDOD domain-containing protein [Photobacterium damselae]|uniref:EAL and HDOD domain-containing protein n=1 Tax=Photobacterium damselae TaxID=38293 RepID=UPI00165E37F5|nr:HDOD domain-containing protein [Photobacterium damselae]ELI6447396.1 HDOD domain-containing protein [Photobacterium damselae]ELI6450403.1 HDOD domain-containing protein [Photobacterium damselae]MCG9703781.1 HDOD domain-containing protein [Photobacterium damselae]